MTDRKVSLTLELDCHVETLLREACPGTALGVYIDRVVQQRMAAWRRGVSELERAGWTSDELRAAAEGLREVLFLHLFTHRQLADELRWVGLRRLARRIARRPDRARDLLCVVLELIAGNAACEHSVGFMRHRPKPWWRSLGAA